MKTVSFLITLMLSSFIIAQPPINERFNLGYDASIFGSVIATDSCYYISSVSLNGFTGLPKTVFVKYKYDTNELIQSEFYSDTMRLDPWQSNNLIKTLDGNFAQIVIAHGISSPSSFMFVKYSHSGDTLITKYYNDFLTNPNYYGVRPSKIIQNSDSTYFAAINVSYDVFLLKISSTGELLWYQQYVNNYFGAITQRMRCRDFIRFSNNVLIFGNTIDNQENMITDKRGHTKLIFVDTLGNLLNEIIYNNDRFNFEVRGLTKTIDNGLLYCGQYGTYLEDEASGWLGFKGQITKLDSNFDLEWRIELGHFAAPEKMDFNMIKTINDSEFVAVGNTRHNGYENNNGDFTRYGWLVKFNIEGEVLWERKYMNVPTFENENNEPSHKFYDVDITKDSGFVMVGQSINYYENNGYGYGQQGWLVKVDKHGCLVPNCQQYDNIDTTNTDTTVVKPPSPTDQQMNNIYPNPVNTNLYYYHTQTDTLTQYQASTAYIYDLRGKTLQKWLLSENNMTYIIDVTNFESATYVLKVISSNGNILRTEKIIVQH